MTLGKNYVTAPVSEWVYGKPQHGGAKCLLLTIGGIAVIGVWQGEVGQHYLAWAALPKRNKELEAKLMQRPRA
ncbi:hypothetical protein [Burkholderia sp. Bp8998]|uniref:hypothetical protein n=1 Tax=Burkholderia sp. Bp8998 TaxID=2184557 RepID=UPI000F569AB6|nr:hypothetical protein [Burkholderia sp. Bp8998]RQR63829.1 hypothetical protein DIE18_06775 [Burkholderia sp. Bp9125]RQS17069.1 hypothetical protein DIE06_17970 [Burkholderia sp. Bp8998]